MLWRYELLTTRIAFSKAAVLIVGGGTFDAPDDLGDARLMLGELLHNIEVMGEPINPDTVRLVDMSGHEVWRSKL